MTKTFKIGEYALGGKIKVSIPKTLTNIKIDVLDSNYGTGKLINQYIYYSFKCLDYFSLLYLLDRLTK